jgi:hypothetical protein
LPTKTSIHLDSFAYNRSSLCLFQRILDCKLEVTLHVNKREDRLF